MFVHILLYVDVAHLYAEIDVVYPRMTHGRYQHHAPPSRVVKVNRLRFFGHILRRLADRLVQRVLRSLPGSSWKKPSGRKRKFWTEVVKEDLRTLGVDRQFRQDVRFRRIWNRLILCKVSQKIEKLGQCYVEGRHTSYIIIIASSHNAPLFNNENVNQIINYLNE
ncbi:hypothetical protein RB195_007759 [Necator americanus]|uniref:Uncharacterized protein n=1 Tax=Necator americanus TaxID=51031 RepID=A0ABR1C1F7_NECAM